MRVAQAGRLKGYTLVATRELASPSGTSPLPRDLLLRKFCAFPAAEYFHRGPGGNDARHFD